MTATRFMFVAHSFILFRHLGIMQLSAVLKSRGVEVGIAFFNDPDLLGTIRAFRPDMIGFSILTPGLHQVLEIIARVKTAFPRTLIVVGGQHPTHNPDLIADPGIDLLVRGEGDLVLPEILDEWRGRQEYERIPNCVTKRGRTPVRDLVSDLDGLPLADRAIGITRDTFLDVGHFIFSRGCPYRCSYCFNHAWNELYRGRGPVFRSRSVDSCLAELVAVKDRHRFVIFWDDCFTLHSEPWLRDFSREYRRWVKLPFTCMMRADTVTDEKVGLLRAANCRSVYLAIEAGSERVRNQIAGRAMDRRTILEANRLVRKHGLNVCAENIIGFPTETVGEMMETVTLNIACRVTVPIFSILCPYPGTAVHEKLKEINPAAVAGDRYSGSFFDTDPVACCRAEDTLKIRNLRALSVFLVRFPVLLNLGAPLLGLPLTGLYDFLNKLYSGYLIKRHIFPYRLGLAGWVRQARHYLTTGRSQ